MMELDRIERLIDRYPVTSLAAFLFVVVVLVGLSITFFSWVIG